MNSNVDGDTSATELQRLCKQNPLPVIDDETVGLVSSLSGEVMMQEADSMLKRLESALASKNLDDLKNCFNDEQALWRDQLAFTGGFHTFISPNTIAENLLEAEERCDISQLQLQEASITAFDTDLQCIDANFSFRTSEPAGSCRGRLLLLPIRVSNDTLQWKIWSVYTQLHDLDSHPENTGLLRLSTRSLDGIDTIEIDVVIVGAGNSGATLAACLKAHGIEAVMIERNKNVGDNWAQRHKGMKFHVPTRFADMRYGPYADNLAGSHLLSKDELAEHLKQYVHEFKLNVITSARILSTIYDKSTKRWTMNLATPHGRRTVISKHLVLATGVGSQKPYQPQIDSTESYQGVNIHSNDFESGQLLLKEGIKTVLIIGSANTAFDVMKECYNAGLEVTMNVRSPTYIIPQEYISHEGSLGVYNFGVEAADWKLLTLPTFVGAQIAGRFFNGMARQEPDRYKPLLAAGFPVRVSTDPNQCLSSHLLERAGGHYVDDGGTKLIADKKITLKPSVEPIAYTEEGVRFSDGEVVKTDAVVWCTGFLDKDVPKVIAEILGGGSSSGKENQLGPEEIAKLINATWGLTTDGEIRGIWKVHDGLSVMGGHTQLQRWFAKPLALQICQKVT